MLNASRKKTGLAPSFKYWVALGVLATVLLGALVLFEPPSQSLAPKAVINAQTITLEVAATPEARAQGLSGRSSLSPGSGLLLVFDAPARHGIWMQDMHFAIDILWIEGGEVVDLKAQATPESYPESFYPRTAASYVLELPAGSLADLDISIGTPVEFRGLE